MSKPTTGVVELKRVFKLDNLILDDPDPEMTPEEVMEFYADSRPILTQAHVEGPEITDNEEIYSFVKSFGTKGAAKAITLRDIVKGTARFSEKSPIDGDVTVSLVEMDEIVKALNYRGNVLLLPSEALGLI